MFSELIGKPWWTLTHLAVDKAKLRSCDPSMVRLVKRFRLPIWLAHINVTVRSCDRSVVRLVLLYAYHGNKRNANRVSGITVWVALVAVSVNYGLLFCGVA